MGMLRGTDNVAEHHIPLVGRHNRDHTGAETDKALTTTTNRNASGPTTSILQKCENGLEEQKDSLESCK